MHPYAFYYIFGEGFVYSNFIFYSPKSTFEPNVLIFFTNKKFNISTLLAFKKFSTHKDVHNFENE
jgi:hypothetical protein